MMPNLGRAPAVPEQVGLSGPLDRLDATAAAVDAATPPDRERVIDLARAVAILAVVIGHWIAAIATYEDGAFAGENALGTVPLLVPLTWLFQVMPLFFVVAGFSGAASWPNDASPADWGPWLHRRVSRIWRPVVVFIGAWMVLSLIGRATGAGETIGRAGHLAMIQLWFLPVYLLATALLPALVAADRRWGWRPVIATTAAAAAADLAGRGFGLPIVGGVNLILVWVLFVLIGIRWRHGALSDSHGPALTVAALVGTVAVTVWGPYPVAMVGVPGEVGSNVTPPTLALVGLGLAQTGLVLTVRSRLDHWLHRPRPWLAVVAVNRRAMTLYLWHLTAAVLAAVTLLPIGFPQPNPGSATWWTVRLFWLLACAIGLAALVARFGRVEDYDPTIQYPGAARVGLAAAMLIAAFLRLTLQGPAASSAPGVDLWTLGLLAGALAAGALVTPRRRRASRTDRYRLPRRQIRARQGDHEGRGPPHAPPPRPATLTPADLPTDDGHDGNHRDPGGHNRSGNPDLDSCRA